MAVCPGTTAPNFPHHWKCQNLNGHPSTECEAKGCDSKWSMCVNYSCPLADGTRRCPDNSIIVKGELEKGHIVKADYRVGGGMMPEKITVISPLQ